MLMTAVIHPEAFNHAHFATPGYRDQAEMLLRGLEINGLLILDPDSQLLKELRTRLEGLSFKDGQQLQIRLAELQNNRKRILVAARTVCNCPHGVELDVVLVNAQEAVVCKDAIVREGGPQDIHGASKRTSRRLASWES